MTNFNELPSLLTAKQTAELLSISRAFLDQDRIKDKPKIPFIKIGTAVRYKKEIIAKILENGTNEQNEQGAEQ